MVRVEVLVIVASTRVDDVTVFVDTGPETVEVRMRDATAVQMQVLVDLVEMVELVELDEEVLEVL